MNFIDDLRRNVASLQALLHSWVVKTIEDNRPMWLDDGTPVGRGSVINYSGTVTKDGDRINLSGGSTASAHAIDGASHTLTGGASGEVLTATGDTTFAFGPITTGMLPAGLATDAEVTDIMEAHTGDINPHPVYLLKTILNNKGDIFVGSANDVAAILGIGTNDQALIVDLNAPNYLKYAVPKFITYISFGSNPQVIPA